LIGLEGVLQGWTGQKRQNPEEGEQKTTDSSDVGTEELSSQETSSQKGGTSTPTSTPKRRLAKRAKVNK